MSTLLAIAFGLVFGGWLIALALKVGAIALIATLGAVGLGVLYGITQLIIDIPWHDDRVLFWSVYGFFGVLGGAAVLVKRIFQLGRVFNHRF